MAHAELLPQLQVWLMLLFERGKNLPW